MSESRVLLVDDEKEFLAVLGERLEARGLTVDTAESGDIALQKAADRKFDVVLLDMAMPGMDGIETLTGLLKINPNLQIILLTGRATLGQAVEVMKLGALDLMEKPVDITHLVERIHDATARKWSLDDGDMRQRVADILREKGW
jgi:DNA-binding NtrC family response regulator